MSGNLNEPEARALREEAQRHQQAGAEHDFSAEIAELERQVAEHQRMFDTMTGTDGINIALPVISLDVRPGAGSSLPGQSEPVDFWRNGILVRRNMLVQGSPLATV